MTAKVVALVKDTFTQWTAYKAPQMGAALAYYTLFSIAPLLIIAIGVAGLVFGEEQARERALQELRRTVDPASIPAIQEMMERTGTSAEGKFHTILGSVVLLFGALGMFAQLQDALNTIWEVKPRPGWGIVQWLKGRFLSFVLVLGIGFLLAVSLAVSAVLTAASNFFPQLNLPGGTSVWQALNSCISFGLIAVLFAMMYDLLPDVHIAWRDVWLGAAVTALLFTAGKHLIGLYLGRTGVSSAFGAAGALVALLVWVYYSAQVFLFGAVFTKVYAHLYGSHPRPEPHASSV